MSEPTQIRPFREFRDHGLLWLVNRVVFHPRGFALAFDVADDDKATVAGWTLYGDGTEPWRYGFSDDEEKQPFQAVEAFLDQHRPETT